MPAFLALWPPQTTQKPQPLIWLARRWTSSSVSCGTPALVAALIRLWMPFMESGRTIAGLFIRAFTTALLVESPGRAGMRRTLDLVCHFIDGVRRGSVTCDRGGAITTYALLVRHQGEM